MVRMWVPEHCSGSFNTQQSWLRGVWWGIWFSSLIFHLLPIVEHWLKSLLALENHILFLWRKEYVNDVSRTLFLTKERTGVNYLHGMYEKWSVHLQTSLTSNSLFDFIFILLIYIFLFSCGRWLIFVCMFVL